MLGILLQCLNRALASVIFSFSLIHYNLTAVPLPPLFPALPIPSLSPRSTLPPFLLKTEYQLSTA